MNRRPVMRALSLWGPVALYMAMIFFVSSLPTAPLPPGVSDKSGHLVAWRGRFWAG